jgi:hypothetical protein
MESPLVNKSNDNRNIEIGPSSILPSREDLKNLEVSDLMFMNSQSHDFDKRLKYFFERDAFTWPAPFTDPENYLYYLFVDRNNHRNIISMVIIKKDIPIEKDRWDKIKGDDIVMVKVKSEQANEIKKELMPKDTNNFYPFRKYGKIIGYIMFTYQICGLNSW